MFECSYNNPKFLIKKINIGTKNKIIVRSGSWKSIYAYAMPSAIYHRIDLEHDFDASEFYNIESIVTDKIKVLVLVGRKSRAYIQKDKLIEIYPEDTVNGIHIVHIEHLKDFLINYSSYIENKEYNISK